MNPYDILDRAIDAVTKLEADPRVLRAEIVGSIRRGKTDVGDLDLLIVTNEPWSFYNGPLSGSRDRSRIAHVFVATPETYGATLLFATGPRQLNQKFRALAARRDLIYDFRDHADQISAQFSPFIALYRADGQLVPTLTEDSIFKLLDVPFVPPAYREWLAERIVL
jgi:DNA polymerase/3'-5' exonuclease PolX